MSYILFLLLGLGISYAIAEEMITLPIREFVIKHSNFFGNLISCAVCTSFWVFLILGYFLTPDIFCIFDGFIGMSVMKIIQKITISLL